MDRAIAALSACLAEEGCRERPGLQAQRLVVSALEEVEEMNRILAAGVEMLKLSVLMTDDEVRGC